MKLRNVAKDKRFFCQTRQFDAAILCGLQVKSMQYGGKRPVVWGCCYFFKQGLNVVARYVLHCDSDSEMQQKDNFQNQLFIV